MATFAPIVQRVTAIIEHDVKPSLQGDGEFLPSFFHHNTWVFSDTLAMCVKAHPTFFQPLVHEHRLITMEYSVLRAGLARDLNTFFPANTASKAQNDADIVGKSQKKLTKEREQELIRKVQAALALAVILEQLYRDYLDVPREHARFLRDQREYRDWLANQWDFKFKPSFLQPAPAVDVGLSISQTGRQVPARTNFFRLLALRLRRWFILMAVVINDFEHYGYWLNSIDTVLGPFFSYLGWIFFLPRLVTNVALTCKHVIGHPGMSDQEWNLGWQTRLRGQMARRLPELANDLAWFISGILACFVLTGNLLPVAIYVAVAMQGYDFISAAVRAGLEISRLQDLAQHYTTLLAKLPKEERHERREIKRHLRDLNQRIDLEQRALTLNLVNFGVLLVAICLTLPVMLAINPLISVIGAVLAIVITIINYVGVQWLDNERRQTYDVAFPKAPTAPILPSPYNSARMFPAQKNDEVTGEEEIIAKKRPSMSHNALQSVLPNGGLQ